MKVIGKLALSDPQEEEVEEEGAKPGLHAGKEVLIALRRQVLTVDPDDPPVPVPLLGCQLPIRMERREVEEVPRQLP